MNNKTIFLIFLCSFLIISLITPALAKEWTLEDTRASIKKNGFKWEAGETSISRLPKEVKKFYFNGLKKEDFNVPDSRKFKKSGIRYPDTFDWRNVDGKNYVTPIRDQKQCGSCWAFCVMASLEAQIKIFLTMDKINPDVSEQYVVSQCYQGGDCGGGQLYSLAAWLETHGVPWESCWPYEARNAACNNRCSDWEYTQQKTVQYFAIENGDFEAMKEAIATKGLLFVGMSVYNDFQAYRGGIYECDKNSGYGGGHGVCLIGYNSTENYWIGKNSWGTGWGEEGFFRVRMGGDDRIGYGGQAYFELNDVANHLWYEAPEDNKFFSSGTKVDIEWHSKGVNKINIYFSSDTGNTYNLVASNVDAAPQSYSWTVPEVESTKCKIKLEDVEHTKEGKCAIGAAITEGVFGVGQQRSVAMNYPKGGETFYNGHKYYLTWDCSANMKNVNIYGSTDGGTSWLPNKVANYSNAQNKTYLWTVNTAKFPATTTGRMKIADAYYEADFNDINDGNFSVSNDQYGFNNNKTGLFVPANMSLEIGPNPCRNQILNIRYALPRNTKVSMKVRNLLGQTVAVLMESETHKSGNYMVHWIPMNYASGVYVIELTTNEKTISKSILIIK
ncbi:MAG: T9SS type A sorting domain-containing protein [Candidatus Coatesbacteria bacterium]|nr:T9SS type A sorting domain-containing protein [Candidatus Coatesbacteria bacterium]